MGVKHILFTSSVASVSCSISPSSVVVLKDHINFSGANPLFGKNVDEWGVRFPDMSDVYDIDKRTCFESKLSCTQVVAGFMCNSHLDSFTDAKFASSLGSTVMMFVPALILLGSDVNHDSCCDHCSTYGNED
jgi:purine-nucleoside phosphorylase